MKQLTILVENRIGALADVCDALGKNGINIEGLSAQGQGNEGVIRIVTEDEKSAVSSLKKAGFSPLVADVLTFKVNDSPGELAKMTRRLSKAGVNIECIYLLHKEKGIGEFAVKADNLLEAQKALRL